VRPPPDEIDSPFTVAAKPLSPGPKAQPEIEGTRPPWLANPAGPLPPGAPLVPATSGAPSPLLPGGFAPKDPFDPEIFHQLTADPAKKEKSE
jgi:hypothetical protein